MLIHAVLRASRTNGPGLRAVIWFQGCLIRCEGCWNPASHPFRGRQADPVALASEVLSGNEPIEGVTFSGGEPMHQAEALLELIDAIRHTAPALSFGVFTGYSERELEAGEFACFAEQDRDARIGLWRAIRARLDFAVMGRYNRRAPSHAPMRTSLNQVLRLFSGRYTEADFAPQEVEIAIAEDGVTTTTGFPVLGLSA